MEKIQNHTRNEWRRSGCELVDEDVLTVKKYCEDSGSLKLLIGKTTLETGGKDVKLQSKRVEKM